jgi:hypothetical protein
MGTGEGFVKCNSASNAVMASADVSPPADVNVILVKEVIPVNTDY